MFSAMRSPGPRIGMPFNSLGVGNKGGTALQVAPQAQHSHGQVQSRVSVSPRRRVAPLGVALAAPIDVACKRTGRGANGGGLRPPTATPRRGDAATGRHGNP